VCLPTGPFSCFSGTTDGACRPPLLSPCRSLLGRVFKAGDKTVEYSIHGWHRMQAEVEGKTIRL
jgi:hypothetical protein